MANSVFRTATKEAIRELIVECGENGRFGLLLAQDDLDTATEKIVDLFETALSLRHRVHERMEMAAAAEPESRSRNSNQRDWTGRESNFSSTSPAFPRTRNAAEIYDVPKVPKTNNTIADMPPAPEFNLRLPRKRVPLTEMEREKLRNPTP